MDASVRTRNPEVPAHRRPFTILVENRFHCVYIRVYNYAQAHKLEDFGEKVHVQYRLRLTCIFIVEPEITSVVVKATYCIHVSLKPTHC